MEKNFRSLKAIDIDLRPVRHHLEDRVRGHVFLCFLAAHLTFHLRKKLAELTTKPHRPEPIPSNPPPEAKRCKQKQSPRTSTNGLPVHTFQGLLTHIGTH